NNSPDISETAEGMYLGKTSTERDFGTVILENGSYYGIYTSPNNPAFAAGFFQGTGTSRNGTFTSTTLRDFNLETGIVSDGSLSASYRPKSSFNGTISGDNGNLTFSGTYEARYEQAPSLTAIAGAYTSSDGGTINIDTSGALNGSIEGCTFSGTVTPRARGNVYSTVVTYGASCTFLASQTLAGVAILDASGKKITAVV